MIKAIIIHCAATPNGRAHDADDIHRWHQERGWDGIGYHYVIRLDGHTENGRPNYWTGAHVGGNNQDTLGICLIGTDSFSIEQHKALAELLEYLREVYPDAIIRGHRDYDSGKTCPGFDVRDWAKDRGIDPK